ncbi:hypothetical protein U2W12_15535 [Methylomicrobium sp. Wu6]|nr:hypothetical protein [Methylomicrobium sp. Wu6]
MGSALQDAFIPKDLLREQAKQIRDPPDCLYGGMKPPGIKPLLAAFPFFWQPCQKIIAPKVRPLIANSFCIKNLPLFSNKLCLEPLGCDAHQPKIPRPFKLVNF